MEINKKKMRKEIHEKHRSLDLVRQVIDSLPDELPGSPYVHTGHWAVYINMPYDWEMYKAIRRALGGDFHSCSVHDDDINGHKLFVLRLHGQYGSALYITLQPTKVGSNCHLEKIGERVTDLYGVICDDGGK